MTPIFDDPLHLIIFNTSFKIHSESYFSFLYSDCAASHLRSSLQESKNPLCSPSFIFSFSTSNSYKGQLATETIHPLPSTPTPTIFAMFDLTFQSTAPGIWGPNYPHRPSPPPANPTDDPIVRKCLVVNIYQNPAAITVFPVDNSDDLPGGYPPASFMNLEDDASKKGERAWLCYKSTVLVVFTPLGPDDYAVDWIRSM